MAGTCWQCQIWSFTVFDDTGHGQSTWATQGVYDAANQGAKVINFSGTFSAAYTPFYDAVNYAATQTGTGAITIVAAGNDNTSNPVYPGAYDNLISVASVDHNANRASDSNYGWWVDLAAGGVQDVVADLFTGSYTSMSGTSFATSVVSGIAALDWTIDQSRNGVFNDLEQYSNKNDYPQGNGITNYGYVNARCGVSHIVTANCH
ncbi:S8 family serine peptidase [Nitrolancea hollandica]|uniref:S8 family serine peptidase n=1 Tax=Nitrolancea hollandica TaxID=1206749 RepID=UPI0023797792|nr:S8 family serine peptidase [Nitrolancea hollandica]